MHADAMREWKKAKYRDMEANSKLGEMCRGRDPKKRGTLVFYSTTDEPHTPNR